MKPEEKPIENWPPKAKQNTNAVLLITSVAVFTIMSAYYFARYLIGVPV